jgi:hypothetical protein
LGAKVSLWPESVASPECREERRVIMVPPYRLASM